MAKAHGPGVSSERHDQSLDAAFKRYLTSGDRSALVDYLLSRSNLPGPRANLELVHRFADSVSAKSDERGDRLWELCTTFIDGAPPAASAGNGMEFIPVCGAVALGGLGSAGSSGKYPYYRRSMERLKKTADDPRWRVREGVAMGLQRLIAARPKVTLRSLQGWIVPGEWYRMRAVAAGVAEPPLLKDAGTATEALELHRTIMTQVVAALTVPSNGSREGSVRSEPFQKLLQCLEYSISVVVSATPEPGFQFLSQLAGSIPSRRKSDSGKYATSAILARLIKENIKKNRLKRYFPEQVGLVSRTLR